ncbi:hypothetical protein G195_001839 [Phytophthora kernoviae 00238/432]|uniref:Nucleoside phosphorylase domain-containing protein n=1 Tax=Phytophthora kernoviae 00238/432 TaxID=1284355 RepID=A0A8J4WFW0_9STRA|nr:hypothetical protein G195_001839 [Phytophthora kernoviae 00238/432]
MRAGIGGGFPGRADVGSLVVADAMVAADLGSQTPDGFLSVDELGFGSSRVAADAALAARLRHELQRAGLAVSGGTAVTVSTATGTAETAAELLRRVPDAAAEGMEGFGVATAAQQFGVPALELRAISNAVGPRDRDAWRIKDALDALQAASSILRELDVRYADIDITNGLAANPDGPDTPEVMKISYAALPYVLNEYALLPAGGALGRGCGPLVLTANGTTDPAYLSGRRVAVPSERSTAYLLFRLWAAQNVPGGVGEIVVMPFDQIMPAVRDGKIDAGLVIHEARFTYQNYDLKLMTDLGNWWESDTGLPIPLGAIIARRNLDAHTLAGWARASVEYAWAHPEESKTYVMEHAQEMDPDVTAQHIGLYVNEFSANLGDDGYGAITALLGRAMKEGLVPEFDLDLLRI